MKKIFKFISLSFIGIILLAYTVLAGFFWWSESNLKNQPNNSPSVYKRIKKPHQMTLINDGVSSLSKRLELLDKAVESIELEFFIFEVDTASKILTNAMIKAAKRGVKVKILVDFSVSVFKLKPIYAKSLEQYGIEVRYYNTANSSRIVSIQHRSHRKLMIIDKKYAMTGGRNIGDDYFSLSSHYNFIDSDVLIEGDIVNTIHKSFYDYWNSDYTTTPDLSQESLNENQLFTLDSRANEILSKITQKQDQINSNLFKATCHDISFVTDFPGISISNRQVYLRLVEFLKDAKHQLDIETPYFILRKDGFNLLKSLHERNIKTNILTNSLYSNDAFYTVSAMIFYLGDLAELNLSLKVHNGEKPRDFVQVINNHQLSQRWGTHSKRAVIDSRHTLIGTYNIDPRSANLNSEVLIICRDSVEIAEYTLASINQRNQSAWQVIDKHKTSYSPILKKSSLVQKTLFILSIPITWLFGFLL